MNRQKNIIGFQVAVFIAFILQPVLLPSQMPGNDPFGSSMVYENIMANILLFGFFYLNFFFLIPKLYSSKKYLLYAFSIALSFCLIICIPKYTIELIFGDDLRPPPPPAGPNDKPFAVMRHGDHLHRFQEIFSDYDHIVFLFILIVCLSLFLWARSRWFRTETARHKAEVSYLLSQINPHFLFNALNSIYTLTVTERADKSSESMLRLSDLMRYMVVESGHTSVPLEREIAYIKDYIALQKLRLDPSVELHCSVSGSLVGKRIAPLLLIPFIENAFKYGVNPDADSEISITIFTEADNFSLVVVNRKVAIAHEGIENTGIGIGNTRERLVLMYPQKHQLSIEDTSEFFTVNLTIILT